VRNAIARSTIREVKIPARVVLTPEALLTAVLVKEPVMGIERTKEPIMLQSPRASISCVASIALPFAKIYVEEEFEGQVNTYRRLCRSRSPPGLPPEG
jgi:hypothetical protein